VVTVEPGPVNGIDNIAQQITGASRAGGEFALKTAESLKIKVAKAELDADVSVPAVLAVFHDAIRYTIVIPTLTYTQGALQALEALKAQRFEPLAVKNFWGANEYAGLNTRWLDPSSGQIFEVQLHTPEGYAAKAGEDYGGYETEGLPGTTEEGGRTSRGLRSRYSIRRRRVSAPEASTSETPVANWRYFTEETSMSGPKLGQGVIMMRVEAGDPWGLAEVLRKPGSWVETDRLERRYLRGSLEGDLTEITADHAQELLLSWLESGRLDALPAHLPLDDSPEPPRGVEAEQARAQLRVRAGQVEADAARRYAQVPVPNGAVSISIGDI
jgi:hypothetical protein